MKLDSEHVMMIKRMKAQHLMDVMRTPVKYNSKVNQDLKLRNKKQYWKSLAKISNSGMIQGSTHSTRVLSLGISLVCRSLSSWRRRSCSRACLSTAFRISKGTSSKRISR